MMKRKKNKRKEDVKKKNKKREKRKTRKKKEKKEEEKQKEKRVKSLLEWEMKKVDLGVGRRLDSKEKGESRTYRERKKK